jgi:hypothetical protein
MPTPPSKQKPLRQPFAAGDYLTRCVDAAWALLIDSPMEKPGWQARAAGGVTQAVFPGTAILFEGKYYEVSRIERRPGAVPRYLYYLSPWEETFPIRTQFAYTPQECLRLAADVRRAQQDSKTLLVLHLLTPFVGMLPRSDQLRIANRYGLNPLRTTGVSAVCFLGLGILLVLLTVVLMSDPLALEGVPLLGRLSPLLSSVLGLAWVVESILRLQSIKSDEPMGSFLLSVPIEIARAVRRQFDPADRQRRFEKMETGAAAVFLAARDDVNALPDGDLEIVSILPKPNWSPVTGISYGGEWYGCIESDRTGSEKDLRYRFVLRKAPPGSAFRTTCEYTPEEVRDRFLEKRRVDLGTWVSTFAPFWGLLEADEQKRLQELYGFHPLKFTAWTIAALGLLSGANVWASLLNIGAGAGTGADAILLLAAGYFLLESVVRFQRWMKNEPSGSALGVLVRPLAYRLLRGY